MSDVCGRVKFVRENEVRERVCGLDEKE